jgi:hypothetical protein
MSLAMHLRLHSLKEDEMKSQLRVMALVAVVGLTGCGATLAQLQKRASVDLTCGPESIRMEEIDSATEVVTGCGKRAIYVQLFNNNRYPTWLLNSNIEQAEVPPGAQSCR